MSILIAEAASDVHFTAAASVELRIKTITDADTHSWVEDREKWYANGQIIDSKLESYFPNAGIKERWRKYYHVLMLFANVS